MLWRTVRQGFSTLRQHIITNALANVPKYGWNDRAIHVACSTLDLSPAAHRIVTPTALIHHSMRTWNSQALRIVDDSNFGGSKGIKAKVGFAIKTRLEQEVEYIDTWAEAMRVGAEPSNLPQTTELLWEFSDEVWRRCGDTATDYNHYTKRILFNAAYASTQLHLLTDQTTDKAPTWNFLQRRLDDIVSTGKHINDIKTVGQSLGNGLLSLLSVYKAPSQPRSPMPPNTPASQEK